MTYRGGIFICRRKWNYAGCTKRSGRRYIPRIHPYWIHWLDKYGDYKAYWCFARSISRKPIPHRFEVWSQAISLIILETVTIFQTMYARHCSEWAFPRISIAVHTSPPGFPVYSHKMQWNLKRNIRFGSQGREIDWLRPIGRQIVLPWTLLSSENYGSKR